MHGGSSADGSFFVLFCFFVFFGRSYNVEFSRRGCESRYWGSGYGILQGVLLGMGYGFGLLFFEVALGGSRIISCVVLDFFERMF